MNKKKRIDDQIVEAVRIGHGDVGRVVGNSLKNLREISGLTQIEMAQLLSVGQAAISKIESRGDIQLSSLQKYVEALGAYLRIDATFCSKSAPEELKNNRSDSDTDENQLFFPLFGQSMLHSQRDVVLSIKPQYSDKILEGKKTVELRRRFPVSATTGTIAHIYSTSPVRALVGKAEIAHVIKLSVKEIWQEYSKTAFIKKKDFDAYFDGVHDGYVLEFRNVIRLPRPIHLCELRERFGFEPPQSFYYANPGLRRALQHEYTVVSH